MDKDNKNDLFKGIADDFKIAVSNYRTAKRENEIKEPYFSWNDTEAEERYCSEEEKRKNSINTSKDYIKLTREEYWKNIIISKIEVIAAIGGFNMMSDFYDYLKTIDTDELLLCSAFSWHADGIDGWCN